MNALLKLPLYTATIFFIAAPQFTQASTKAFKFMQHQKNYITQNFSDAFFNLGFSKINFKSESCPDLFEVQFETQIQQIAGLQGRTCYLMPSNRNNFETLIYRSYLFSSAGSMLAFLSFGEGPESETTGAKEFYFFPRKKLNEQSFVWNLDDISFNIQTNAAYNFYFDAKVTEILSVKNAQVKLSKEIRKDNNGGIFLTPEKGLIFELPFTLGSAPSTQLNLSGKLLNSKNQICKLKIGQVFRKTSDGDSEIKLTDAELKKLVTKSCPSFMWAE